MEQKTITLEGVDYYLIPKPKKTTLPEGVEIKFHKIEVKTYFEIEVRGWCSYRSRGGKIEENPWIIFTRIEYEDGSFEWTTPHGVRPDREKELIVESWYQNYINS